MDDLFAGGAVECPPVPGSASVARSGFFFSHATSAARSFGSRVLLPRKNCGLLGSITTGSKSLSTSYCTGKIAGLET